MFLFSAKKKVGRRAATLFKFKVTTRSKKKQKKNSQLDCYYRKPIFSSQRISKLIANIWRHKYYKKPSKTMQSRENALVKNDKGLK